MAKNNKYQGKIDSNNLGNWLCSAGFLFPKNEMQLARFNQIYSDYDFKLKDTRIDVKSILDGNVCFMTRVIKIVKEDEIKDIEELKMVARKGQEVPKHIIEKMKQKHRKSNDGEEQ